MVYHFILNFNKFSYLLNFILGSSHSTFSDEDIQMTVLALRTLGTFDFEGKKNLKFLLASWWIEANNFKAHYIPYGIIF